MRLLADFGGQLRAKGGSTPDGKSGKPINASRFSSYQDMAEAIKIAQSKNKVSGLDRIEVDMGRVIGDGYLKGGVTYVQTTKVVVRFDSGGNPITAFPKLN